jgi:NADPH:quinone reductase-like Zn-dependent oxidoreductase
VLHRAPAGTASVCFAGLPHAGVVGCFLVASAAASGLESAVFNQRQRFLVWAAASIVGIWLAALAGHRYFEKLRMTADKVHAYVESVNFGQLTGAARGEALAVERFAVVRKRTTFTRRHEI